MRMVCESLLSYHLAWDARSGRSRLGKACLFGSLLGLYSRVREIPPCVVSRILESWSADWTSQHLAPVRVPGLM
jgi:hypothetical protein